MSEDLFRLSPDELMRLAVEENHPILNAHIATYHVTDVTWGQMLTALAVSQARVIKQLEAHLVAQSRRSQ